MKPRSEERSLFLIDEQNKPVPVAYTLVRSKRRTWAICLSCTGALTLRAPLSLGDREAECILRSRQSWILQKRAQLQAKAAARPVSTRTEDEKRALEKRCRALAAERIPQRIAFFQTVLPCRYERLSIRGQKTRWGSCSSRGTLSFNWKLMLAPPEILDYVIVHELCHLTHMNHSPAFWALVASVLPDYRERRRWLRENGALLEP